MKLGINKIKKFYLRNVGTMLNEYKDFTPTTEQQTWLDNNVPQIELKANQGDVYSLVEILPKLSDIKDCIIYCKPTTLSDDTVLATIKFFANMKTEPIHAHKVTAKDASRGYVEIKLNRSNINSIQTKVEYNTDLLLGDNDFTPLTAVLDYQPKATKR